MTFLKNILLLGMLAATIVFFVTTVGSAPCTDVASEFLSKIQEKDTGSLLSLFGENSCHCQPRGGYIAYLKYESGENDNLAFLLGHKFKTGAFVVKQVPTIEKVPIPHIPFEAPESAEVDVPFSFDKSSDSPFFVPLDSAYGYSIKESELDKFCQDPSKDFWQALSLRLRPSLGKGVVPGISSSESVATGSKPGASGSNKQHKSEFMADVFKEILPSEQAKYLKPTDLGDVITVDGKKIAIANFAAKMPRLKSGVLRLYMGRRGKFERWAVRKGRLKDSVFVLSDGKTVGLSTPATAMLDIHGPAVESSKDESIQSQQQQ